MRARPTDDFWYRFDPGDRVEGIPGSATLRGRRGTFLGYHDRNDTLVVVQFDDEVDPESEPISLLQKLGAVESLGELA